MNVNHIYSIYASILKQLVVQDFVLQVAGDMLFQDQKFDICQVINYFKTKVYH